MFIVNIEGGQSESEVVNMSLIVFYSEAAFFTIL